MVNAPVKKQTRFWMVIAIFLAILLGLVLMSVAEISIDSKIFILIPIFLISYILINTLSKMPVKDAYAAIEKVIERVMEIEDYNNMDLTEPEVSIVPDGYIITFEESTSFVTNKQGKILNIWYKNHYDAYEDYSNDYLKHKVLVKERAEQVVKKKLDEAGFTT